MTEPRTPKAPDAVSDRSDARLLARLTRHEGLRLKPYRDTGGKLTIGIGRNLTDVGITASEATYLLGNDVQTAIAALKAEWPWALRLEPQRAEVMIELVFNMGAGALRQFKQFLIAMEAGAFTAAAADLLESEWAREVGQRAQELAAIIRTAVAADSVD
jgi:lysozyme